jgi:hypothetical protein
MTLSNNLDHYIAEMEMWNSAADSAYGIAFKTREKGTAKMWQTKLHKCRVLLNQDVYLDFTVKTMGRWVYIRRDIIPEEQIIPKDIEHFSGFRRRI